MLVTYQAWRHFGESVLVAGLVGELLVIVALEWWIEHRYGLSSDVISKGHKMFAEMFCTVLVLAGVGIENLAGSRIDSVIDQMRLSMAVGINRVTPRNEILKTVAPELIASLGKYPDTRVAIFIAALD
jgi:hypothetical protein